MRTMARPHIQAMSGDSKPSPNIPITDPCLVGLYNFNEDEETVVIDWSGRGNHSVQIRGEPIYVAGFEVNAIEFDGVDDAVEVPRMVQSNFTLMAWIKTDTHGAEGTTGREGSGLIWSDYSGGGDHFTLAVLGKKLAFETGAAPTTTTISYGDVVTGDWVHVAATRTSAGQIELFIDGSSDNTGGHTTRTLAGSTKIAIGANLFDSRYYTGLIDEVRIYNRVLTPDEIGQAINPPKAWMPRPANGTTDVQRNPALAWRPGKYAASHKVYLDPDEAKVQARTYL